MFKINGKEMVVKLVDYLLDRKSVELLLHGTIRRPGIIIPVSLETNNYDIDRRKIRNFLILFMGNTSVFFTQSKHLSLIGETQLNELKWKNTSNHDSCWRDDGLRFITENYFDMCEKICPTKAPKDVDTEMNIGWLSLGIKKVMVTARSEDGRPKIQKIEIMEDYK